MTTEIKKKKSLLQSYEIQKPEAIIINIFLTVFGTLSGFLSSNPKVFY